MLNKSVIKANPLAWYYRGYKESRKLRREISNINAAFQKLNRVTDYSNERVLIFTSVSLFTDHLITEYLLGSGFRALGASVRFVLCDKELPICHAHDRYSCGYPAKLNKIRNVCNTCSKNREVFTKTSLFDVTSYNGSNKNIISLEDEKEIIKSGTVRFRASSMMDDNNIDGLSSLYRQSFDIAQGSIARSIEDFQPTMVLGHHGIYVPQGIVNKIANLSDIDFYSWHFGYRKSTLIFSKGNTYHKELLSAKEFNRNMSSLQIDKIKKYLTSRKTGSEDWIHFNRKPELVSNKNTDYKKRICFFTSVDWDAALHFENSCFESQFDFLQNYLEAAKANPEIEFNIRVHPAEESGFHPSSYSISRFVTERCDDISSNVKIIQAGNNASSYDIADQMDLCVIYNTKLGIELCATGKRTIVAGDAWVKGRGFTWDLKGKSDLNEFLKNDDFNMTNDEINEALAFAHYFYFNRCVYTPELKSETGKFQIKFNPAALNNKSPIVEICKQLLNKNKVIKNIE